MKLYFKSLSDQLINQPQDGKTLVERYASNQSDFCQAVVTAGYLSQQQMEHAALQYHLGKSTTGGVIFWEIDEEQRIRDGKVMTYLSNCHRNKEKPPTWVSFLLKKQNAIPHVFDAKQCLFGQHLLPKEDSSIIAVVEAEKTAVICSELFPEYCWMATGAPERAPDSTVPRYRRNRPDLHTMEGCDTGSTRYVPLPHPGKQSPRRARYSRSETAEDRHR